MRRQAAFTVEIRRTIRRPVKRTSGAGRTQVASPSAFNDDADAPVDMSPEDLPVRDVNEDLVPPPVPTTGRFRDADNFFKLKPMGADEGRSEIQQRAPLAASTTSPTPQKFRSAEALFKKPETPKAAAPSAEPQAPARRVLPSLLAPSFAGRDTVPARMQQQADRYRAGYEKSAESRRGVPQAPRPHQGSLFDSLESSTARVAPVVVPKRALTASEIAARDRAAHERMRTAREAKAAKRNEAAAEVARLEKIETDREAARKAQRAVEAEALQRAVDEATQKAEAERRAAVPKAEKRQPAPRPQIDPEAVRLAAAERRAAVQAAREAEAQAEAERLAAAKAAEEQARRTARESALATRRAAQEAAKASREAAEAERLENVAAEQGKTPTSWIDLISASKPPTPSWSWADVMAEEDPDAEPVTLSGPAVPTNRVPKAMLYNPWTVDSLKRDAVRYHVPRPIAARALKPGERWKRRMPVATW